VKIKDVGNRYMIRIIGKEETINYKEWENYRCCECESKDHSVDIPRFFSLFDLCNGKYCRG
jgi:hypothetical protein